MDKKIEPRRLKGFWELMPEEQILFSEMLSKLEKVFKQNCFVPLDTPVLEYSDVLLAKSGGDVDKEIYRFTKGDTDMCMRYDLTVPLARFVAMHQNELNFPFKRYQIGKVYRGERPQKGRYREFYQCDADIIGDGALSQVADAECISLFEKCFKELGLEVRIEVSNRKILAGYLEEISKTDKSTEIFIVLDKLSKIPLEEIKRELEELGLNSKECENLIKITQKTGKIEEIVENLRNFCKNELFQKGLNEFEELAAHLKAFGTKCVVGNLGIIRGHNYYTGTVFEGFLKDGKDAVGAGGRFENLCGYFSEKNMPGVGMSVGITRLFSILTQNGYFKEKTNEVDISIITFDDTLHAGLELMTRLRESGVKADCLYEAKTFKAKMKEANRRGVNYVLIVGEDEVKEGEYTLKDMQTSQQEKLTFEKLVEKFTKNG